ncbi:MAG: glycosyltransferase [Anaerolineae bacterium]|nr:glycosyltransferase [Anaerolineae bacterium]
MSKKVLIVAYYFPPIGGSGVVRIIKLAKYLPQFGWEPTVLTVAGGDSFVFDTSMINELPETFPIERAPAWEIIKTTQAKHTLDRVRVPGRQSARTTLRQSLAQFLRALYFSVFIPDDKLGWLWPATRKAVQVARMHTFDVIFATSPPQTDLLIAARLKRRLHIPVVLDYRDEWTTNPHKLMPNVVTRWLQRLLERRTLAQADALTLVSEGMLDHLHENALLPKTPPKCVLLPNGFDPADFPQDESVTLSTDRFHIVYTGSFYGEYRVPDPFLHALHTWLTQNPDCRADVKVTFYGSIYPRHQYLIETLGLHDVIEVAGNLPHHQVVAAQRAAAALLLIIGAGEGKAVLTGKIFEYLGAQRSILAIAPMDGEAAALVQRTNTGVTVSPEAVPDIAQALEHLYLGWKTNSLLYAPNTTEVAKYSRVEQAQQLSRLFTEIGQA